MILDDILAYKRTEIEALRANGLVWSPPETLRPAATSVPRCMPRRVAHRRVQTPLSSKGEIRGRRSRGSRSATRPPARPRCRCLLTPTSSAGPSPISTPRRGACELPVLRKDFLDTSLPVCRLRRPARPDCVLLIGPG